MLTLLTDHKTEQNRCSRCASLAESVQQAYQHTLASVLLSYDLRILIQVSVGRNCGAHHTGTNRPTLVSGYVPGGAFIHINIYKGLRIQRHDSAAYKHILEHIFNCVQADYPKPAALAAWFIRIRCNRVPVQICTSCC